MYCSTDSSGTLNRVEVLGENGIPEGAVRCWTDRHNWFPTSILGAGNPELQEQRQRHVDMSQLSGYFSGPGLSGTPTPPYVPSESTNAATSQVVNSGASTSSTLPANSPGHATATSSQASAAASLPADSPGLKQMTGDTKGSATTTTSTVAANGTPSPTAAAAAPTDSGGKVRALFLAVVAASWVLFGILAFFFSLICFGYSGSFGEKVFGFILAIIFGPFYFVYYFADGAYCRANAPTLF